MTFTPDPTDVADLVEVYQGDVPPDLASKNRSLDDAYTIATVLATAHAAVKEWVQGIAIGTAVGSQLDAQGTNEGLKRQSSEGDETYRARLRVPPAAGTWQSIVDALQAVATAAGAPSGSVFLVELPRDGAYLNSAPTRTRSGLVSKTAPMRYDIGYTVSTKNSSFFNRGRRLCGGPVRMLIALIPAGFSLIPAITDALRSKKSAAKAYLVLEYTS